MKLKFGFVKLRYRGLQKKLFGLCSKNNGIPLEFSSAFSMVHRLHTKCRLTVSVVGGDVEGGRGRAGGGPGVGASARPPAAADAEVRAQDERPGAGDGGAVQSRQSI